MPRTWNSAATNELLPHASQQKGKKKKKKDLKFIRLNQVAEA
jgi:hypothetical protein